MRIVVAIALVLLAASLVRAGGNSEIVAFLRAARATHQAWAAYYRAFPAEQQRLVPRVSCTGDTAYNELWMSRYDAVLRYLGEQP